MRGSARWARIFTLAASLLLLLSVMALPVTAAASSTSTTSTTSSTSSQTASTKAVSLVLSVIPPKLPADGGSYPAIVVSLQSGGGAASLALNDTAVFLTSSQEGVGSVPSKITIPAGAGFAVANFTTSTTPGSTSISASSAGLSATSEEVTTVTPSGFPTRLSVIPVPGSQLLNPTSQGTVLVETLDSAGLPAKASSPIEVSLTSSNNNIVSLPSSSLTVEGGSVLSSAAYAVGSSPGTATITGSASGFNSGSGEVSVQGASPFALAIFAQPDPISTSTTGRLVVTLTDAQGNPSPAPAPITVSIASSNTSVVASDVTTTIATGQIYSVAAFTSGPSPGNANLTASSPGLQSDFAVVTVEQPASPVKLTILAAPNPVLADAGMYGSVVVALADAGGNPAVASSGVSVTLTSSNSAAGDIGESLTIPSGSSYAVATFTSTFFVGGTFITAIAQNLQSATFTLTSYGPVPTQLFAQAVPSTLPADGGQYSALEVTLESADGVPAVAPVDIPVQLTSSSTAIATVNSTVVIAAGESYVLAPVTTTISPGTANISATSSGFEPSSAGFTTASPAPSQLGFYAAPASGIQSLGTGDDAIVAVQLQDSGSSPALARQDTQVTVTSSNSSVIANPINFDIEPGMDYAWAMVNTSAPGSTVLTASTSGLASASASLSDSSPPVTVTLASSAPEVAIGTPATVQLQIQVLGSPLSGANVTLAASSGTMTAPSGVTDSSGSFTDTFVPAQNGVAIITALVQDPLVGNLTASTNVFVVAHGESGTGASGSKGLGALGSALVVVLVIVVVVLMAFAGRRILRSRRTPGEEDGGGDDAPPADFEK
ncbi:MAG: Ig-like domain-containing protein [Thaumarchaeota archaeon]|nr:Ig-like domain-containing protein [Nitrososphaerota archaeon]